MDTNIQRAKDMLDALKLDMKTAYDRGQRYVSHINLEAYQKSFCVSDDDVAAYCATLTLLTPVHPKCVICGGNWGCYKKSARPVGNGHYIEWVDGFTMYCCPDDGAHGVIWYYQNADGTYNFDYEMKCPEGQPQYWVRWNCDYPDEFKGKNVVIDADKALYYDYDKGNCEYIVLGTFDPPLPYTITYEELTKLL